MPAWESVDPKEAYENDRLKFMNLTSNPVMGKDFRPQSRHFLRKLFWDDELDNIKNELQSSKSKSSFN